MQGPVPDVRSAPRSVRRTRSEKHRIRRKGGKRHEEEYTVMWRRRTGHGAGRETDRRCSDEKRNSTTAPSDIQDPGKAKMILLALSETVGTRLRKAGVKAEVLSVGIRNFEFGSAEHQMILENPTNLTEELYHAACRLLDELWQDRMPIRQIGIHASRLRDKDAPRQLHLFDSTDYVKLEKLDHTVDEIRRRYGNDSVMRSVFLKQEDGPRPIDHMEGGISREKRTVDYAEIEIQ